MHAYGISSMSVQVIFRRLGSLGLVLALLTGVGAVATGPTANAAGSPSPVGAYGWGFNINGQLGNGDTNSSLAPVATSAGSVPAGKSFSMIDAGNVHTCGIADGRVYCWGRDNNGSLGNGVTGVERTTPTLVSGLPAGTATAVSAGADTSCAVVSGAAYCWGLNSQGQLGNGNQTNANTAQAVDTSGVLAGKTVTAIATDSGRTCAVASGAAYCWGQAQSGGGVFGLLGNGWADGFANLSTTPVAVKADAVSDALYGKTVTGIAVASLGSCALAEGAAYCWGYNQFGILGTGSSSATSQNVPIAVNTSGALSGKTVTAISAANTNVCVVASSEAFCWGYNANGEVGNGDNTNQTAPAAVSTSGVLASKIVTAINVGNSGACAVASGAAYCWGLGNSGRLGNGSTSNSNIPVAVDTSGVLEARSVTAVAAGASFSLALAPTPGPLTFSSGSFGSAVGVGSATSLTVTVTNSGSGAVTPSAITVVGTNVTRTGGTCATATAIAASATCTVILAWSPATSGSLSGASLTIAYPGGASASNNVSLTGTADIPGPLTFSSGSFGAAFVGIASPLTVTVTNTGNGSASPSAITPAGTGVAVTGGTCATTTAIAASGTCTVVLSWTPSAVGALSGGSLTIDYPGGSSPSDALALSGTATPGGGGGGGSSSGESTTTTSSTASTPNSLDPITANQVQELGGSVTTVGGTAVPVIVRANGTNTALDVAGPAFTLQVAAQTPNGSAVPLAANGSLLLDQGGTVRAVGTGYESGAPVRVYMLSTPVLLGTLTADANGAFAGVLAIPASVTPGLHTLQINGYTPNGQVRSVSLGVEIATPGASNKPLGTRVVFAYKSSELTKRAQRSLKALVGQVPTDGTPRTIVVGVVRAAGANAADVTLARARAKKVTAYLRSEGLTGAIVTKVAKARVTNTYQSRRVNISITMTTS